MRKLGVPYFGVLIIRILLIKGTRLGSPIFGNSQKASMVGIALGGILAMGYAEIICTACSTSLAYYRGLNNYQYSFGIPYFNYSIRGPKTRF